MERREERSTSAPERICALMWLGTGGGSRAGAFGGAGIGIAEMRENGDRAWGREKREGICDACAAGGGVLALASAPRATAGVMNDSRGGMLMGGVDACGARGGSLAPATAP